MRLPRWTYVLALAGAALGGSVPASADTRDPIRQIRLARLANDDLRIEWHASVSETGGEFLLTRSTPAGPRRLLARLTPGPENRYRVTDTADPGAWVYELRYRDARGRELVLATVELNLDELERGTAAASARAGLGSVAAIAGAEAFHAAPSRSSLTSSADDGLTNAHRGRPPTPPPRAHA